MTVINKEVKYLQSLKEKNFHKLIIGAALKDFKAIEDYFGGILYYQ